MTRSVTIKTVITIVLFSLFILGMPEVSQGQKPAETQVEITIQK